MQTLVELLDDELKLATDSDSYKRTSCTSDLSISRADSFTTRRPESSTTSLVSESSYTTACDKVEVTTTPTACDMAKQVEKTHLVKGEAGTPLSLKKRKAPQPRRNVSVPGSRPYRTI